MDSKQPDILPAVEVPAQGSEVSHEARVQDGFNEAQIDKRLEQDKVVSQGQASAQAQGQALPSSPIGQDSVADIGSVPQIADDTDLIEKEWVDKAKLIVARTVHDPRQQSIEMNSMKADYLKKRYNKEIKQSE